VEPLAGILSPLPLGAVETRLCGARNARKRSVGVANQNPLLLLVEDNPDHEVLISLALEGAGLQARVRAVPSGEMALQYLFGFPPFDNLHEFPRPSLILLDLGLPGMSGFDVLRAIRESKEIGQIPVMVLTVSDEPSDRRRAMDLGATAYQLKQADFSVLGPIVRDLLRSAEERACG
jgi:CheY-like chemotaxis protein